MTRTIQSHAKLNTHQLCDRLGMNYGTYLRWRRRSERGQPLLGRPGPRKVGPLPFEEVRRDIAALVHQTKRSAGSGALHLKYQDSISRRDLQGLITEERKKQNQARRQNFKRITWKEPNLCWAIDATEYGRDEFGRKLYIVATRDLASRHYFEPLVTLSTTGVAVTEHVRALFRRHGVPLVLKRDNGSPFKNESLDALLAEACVIPLTSPANYPRYNGAIENAIRELKETIDDLSPGLPLNSVPVLSRLAHAAVQLRNGVPRPCLDQQSAAQNYHHQPRSRFDKRRRHAIFEWIKTRSTVIIEKMNTAHHRSASAAWRRATESWLRRHDLISVLTNQQVSPLFTHEN